MSKFWKNSIIVAQAKPEHVSTPNLDPGIYSLAQTVLWFIFISIIIVVFYKYINSIPSALALRVKRGVSLKIWNIEFGALRVDDSTKPVSKFIDINVDKSRYSQRQGLYEEFGRFFIVHRLFPSEKPGQLYDILIYVRGHENESLDNIDHVEYYLGESWGHNVFSSSDRGSRFGIVISAFGAGFLCLANIHLRNKNVIKTWRYVDYEMGDIGMDSSAN